MAKKQEYQVGFPVNNYGQGAQNGYPQGMNGYGYPQGTNGYPNGYPNGYDPQAFGQGQQPVQPAQQPQEPKKEKKKKEATTKVKYLPRSFLWNIIGLCLAFFFGIFACLGAIVGVVVLGAKKAPVNKLLSSFGADASKYVSEAYLDKTVLDLAGDLLDDARNKRLTNFDAVAKYSPAVKRALDSVAAQFADMGVRLNVEEIMGVEFSSLGSYLSNDVLMNVAIGDVMKLTGDSSPLMLTVCYGTEGEDYTVGEDGAIVMAEGKSAATVKDLSENAEEIIGRIEVGAALGVNASSEAAMRYLAYGSEGVDYDITDGEIVMRAGKKSRTISSLSGADADVVNGARIRDLVTIDKNSSEFMQAVSDWKISDLANGYKIKRLKIGQIVTVGDDSSAFLKAMRDWRIEELTEGGKLDTVTLGDLVSLSDSSPDIIKALQNTSLCDLSRKVETLRLASVLGESEINSNKLLKNLKNSTMKTLSDDIAALTVEDVFADEIYAYLSLTASGNKSYSTLLLNYETTGRKNEALSAKRPTPIPDNAVVTERAVLRNNPGTTVTEGYFLGKSRVEEENVYRAESGYATLVKTKVTPVYDWRLVDYAAGGLAPLGNAEIREEADAVWYISGDKFLKIQEDVFGAYVQDGTERIDLERAIVGYKLDGKTYSVTNGQIAADDGKTYVVYAEGEESYIEREFSVTKGYASENGTQYTESQVLVRRFASWTDEDGVAHTDEAVDRYLSGVWYLLFSQTEQGAKVPVQDVAKYITDAQKVLTDTPLWKLYFHGIVNENPYRDFSGSGISGASGNLNEYSIDGIIALLKKIG